jgi:hypothetical protein
VARDAGDEAGREKAHALYDAASRRAHELEVPWIELAALAGAALTNGGPAAESTRGRWRRANELLATARPDWWFPGRELVDALAVHITLVSGQEGAAFDLFTRSARSLDAVDPFAGAWLVAECGDALRAAGLPSFAAAQRLAAGRASAMGFAPLVARLTETVDARR